MTERILSDWPVSADGDDGDCAWPVIEHDDWPTTLDDARAIGRFVEQVDADGEADGRLAEDLFFGCRAVLRRIPLVDRNSPTSTVIAPRATTLQHLT